MSVRRRPPGRHEAGFSLVELLVAALLTAIVTGAVIGAVGPAQRLALVQPEMADLQQRLRVGVDVLRHDLLMAGAGIDAGPAVGPLGDLIAPVLPYRAFGATPDPLAGTFYRSDAFSILYVPATPSQTVLASPLAPGATWAALGPAPNCPADTDSRTCGLAAGDRILLLDRAGRWSVHRASAAGSGDLFLEHQGAPPPHTYEAGTAVTGVRAVTYLLSVDRAQGTSRLMRHDGWATTLPVVEDVVGLEVRYFGAGEPPRLTGAPLDGPGPWTTYGPAPPAPATPVGAWPPGENCVFRLMDGLHLPRLTALAAGARALVELTPDLLTDGPWCPDAASPNRFDADLLRVRRLRLTLRVQAAPSALRGPVGPLFRFAGTARAGDLWAPDLEVTFDVSPRNLSLPR